MLDKKLSTIFDHAFQDSRVKHPDSDLTEKEYSDATYTLNSMLQEWNNDGFRLFKMHDGYLPLMAGKSDYQMGKDAFKKISQKPLKAISQVGATKVLVRSVVNMSTGLRIMFSNATQAIDNTIADIDEEKGEVTLETPLMLPLTANDDVFYGRYNTGTTNDIGYDVDFDTIPYEQDTIPPSIGDTLLLNYNGNWMQVQVTGVSTTQVQFAPKLANGNITDARIFYGSVCQHTKLIGEYPLSMRRVELREPMDDGVVVMSFKTDDKHTELYAIESIASDRMSAILTKPLTLNAARYNGRQWLDADKKYRFTSVLKATDLSSFFDGQTPTLTDFVRRGTQDYVCAHVATETGYTVKVIWRDPAAGWRIGFSAQSPSPNFRMLRVGAKVLIFAPTPNEFSWLADITEGGYSLIGPQIYGGCGWAVDFMGDTYLIGGSYHEDKRDVVRIHDGVISDEVLSSDIRDASAPCEFMNKLYMGDVFTTVTTDMQTTMPVPIHAKSRCVVDGKMYGINADEVCNYTSDSVNFKQLPFMYGRSSTWASVHDMAIISIYNLPEFNQPDISQIFTANKFASETWTMQAVMDGKCSRINVGVTEAILVADFEIASMELLDEIRKDDEIVWCFGEPIGRPQEIMNVVRYDSRNSSMFPIEQKAFADFTRLPHGHGDDNVICCCFMRETEDAKLMVWGTPKRVGDYLKFTYVSPLGVSLNARDIPDIPDEYVGAVIDGMAYRIAVQYGAPADLVQLLKQKADESKEVCLSHDNEDTSYRITPNFGR